ncbi:uncharacterized protein LOC119278862 [Triticum dicoccoides]|uniref:uncharacterized protein LOC119278862 n=1 Tax=Triticum dicoccoides TaxID=85692 RepID=UPI0018902DB3|nr:uncharacterized protein LOC119278862 [Triticum dicoccoides]XP_037416100.1 uncharacterized protein LOC119278862 [Triticum dicoccoides]XP_037416102.1 uncharacterized protein LOC119278862 [Triticum dicoccoides]XP_037416103.1 uncharacterized protein LOC119278862 [Triticum dicoccoides]XP_037416104.1 uncharacterized protein LOC119278862 [Triticum dicoccoides]XP_037416105.1 uncharacterized protein LOC119278862 [Triticum dicoccoides]XP_037416106.1 uncharacterized protein LOC119278862 [Triticum dic
MAVVAPARPSAGRQKKAFNDYSDLARAAHPDDWEQRELDGQILYESLGGIPHGRLAIAGGAIKKADVISTAREKILRLSTSAAHQRTVQENEELKRHNENLQRHNENLQHKVDMHERILVALFKEMGKELPAELRQGASSQPHGTPNSSHMRSQAADDNTGDDDLGTNGGADNSSGNTSDQAIDATNLCTTNVGSAFC